MTNQVEYQFSAGGVVVGRNSVLLIRTKNFRGNPVWTFPKGRVEQGEKTQEAALREVREETGFQCRVVRPLEPTTFWFRREGKLIKKNVRWFLLRPQKRVGEHDPREVDEVAWFSYHEALDRLTFTSDQELLAAAWPQDVKPQPHKHEEGRRKPVQKGSPRPQKKRDSEDAKKEN